MQRPGKLRLTPSPKQGRRRYDQRRSVREYRAWYKTARWRRAREAQLSREPLCWMCLEEGRTTPATICDHNTPHRGDPELFWDPKNHGSLCKTHHDGAKQRMEANGQAPAPMRQAHEG